MTHAIAVMEIRAIVVQVIPVNVDGATHAIVGSDRLVNVAKVRLVNAMKIVIRNAQVTFQIHPAAGMTKLTLMICCIC